MNISKRNHHLFQAWRNSNLSHSTWSFGFFRIHKTFSINLLFLPNRNTGIYLKSISIQSYFSSEYCNLQWWKNKIMIFKLISPCYVFHPKKYSKRFSSSRLIMNPHPTLRIITNIPNNTKLNFHFVRISTGVIAVFAMENWRKGDWFYFLHRVFGRGTEKNFCVYW